MALMASVLSECADFVFSSASDLNKIFKIFVPLSLRNGVKTYS